jgi:hypothetical protein
MLLVALPAAAELPVTSRRLWRFNTTTSSQYMFGTADFAMLRPMEQDDVFVYEFSVGASVYQNDTIHLEVAFGKLPSYSPLASDAFELSAEFAKPGQYIDCIDTACSTPTMIELADTTVSPITGLSTIRFQVLLYTLEPAHTGDFGIIVRVLSATTGNNARPTPPVLTARLQHTGFDAIATSLPFSLTSFSLTKFDIANVGTDIYAITDYFPMEPTFSYLYYENTPSQLWSSTDLPLVVTVALFIPRPAVAPINEEMVLAVRVALRQEGEYADTSCLLPVLAPYCQCVVIAPLQYNNIAEGFTIDASLSCPRGSYTYDSSVIYLSVIGPAPVGTYSDQSGFQTLEIPNLYTAGLSYFNVTSYTLAEQTTTPETPTTLFPTESFATPTSVFVTPDTEVQGQMSSSAHLVRNDEGVFLAPHGSAGFPLQFTATLHDGLPLVRVVYVFDNTDALVQGDEIVASVTFGFLTPAHISPALTVHLVMEFHEWDANLPCLASPSCRRTTHVPVSYVSGVSPRNAGSGTVTLSAALPIRNVLATNGPFAIGVRVINSTGDNPLVFPGAASVQYHSPTGFTFYSRSYTTSISTLPPGDIVYSAGSGQYTLSSPTAITALPNSSDHALQISSQTAFNETVGPSMLPPSSLELLLGFFRSGATIPEFGRIFAYRVSWLTNLEAIGSSKWCAVPVFGASCTCSAVFPVTANQVDDISYYEIAGTISCPRNVVMSTSISIGLVSVVAEGDPLAYDFTVPALEDASLSFVSLTAHRLSEITTVPPTESPTSQSPVSLEPSSVASSPEPSTTFSGFTFGEFAVPEMSVAAFLVVNDELKPYAGSADFAMRRNMTADSPRAVYVFMNPNAFPQGDGIFIDLELGLSQVDQLLPLPDDTVITLELHEFPPNVQCLSRPTCRQGTRINITGPYMSSVLSSTGNINRLIPMPIPPAFYIDGPFLIGMRVASASSSHIFFTFPPKLLVLLRMPTPYDVLEYEPTISRTFSEIFADNRTRLLTNVGDSLPWPVNPDEVTLPGLEDSVVNLGIGTPPELTSDTAFYASTRVSIYLTRSPLSLVNLSGIMIGYRVSWLTEAEAASNNSCMFPADDSSCECSAIFALVEFERTQFRIQGVLNCPNVNTLSGVLAVGAAGTDQYGSPLTELGWLGVDDDTTSTVEVLFFLVDNDVPNTTPTALSPATESPTSVAPPPPTESTTSIPPSPPTSIAPPPPPPTESTTSSIPPPATTEVLTASLGSESVRISLIAGVTVATVCAIVLVGFALAGCAKYGSYQLIRS